ncbi:MAG: hypothetical protein R3B68_16325 [Phycisphaerales bacterium]
MKIAAVVVACWVASVGHAAIVYTDIPDITIGWTGVAAIDFDRDGSPEVHVLSFDTGLGPWAWCDALEPGSRTLIDPLLTWPGSTPTYWAERPDAGALIGPSAEYQQRASLLRVQDFGGAFGKWLEFGAAHLGVEFKIGSAAHYGWIRVDLSETTISDLLVVRGFAYESEPGVPIAAGAVPGPGGAGVVMAVSVLGGARRRRWR